MVVVVVVIVVAVVVVIVVVFVVVVVVVSRSHNLSLCCLLVLVSHKLEEVRWTFFLMHGLVTSMPCGQRGQADTAEDYADYGDTLQQALEHHCLVDRVL